VSLFLPPLVNFVCLESNRWFQYTSWQAEFEGFWNDPTPPPLSLSLSPKQTWNWTDRPKSYGSCNFQYFHFRNCCTAGGIHITAVITSLSNYVMWLLTTSKNSDYCGVCITRQNILGFHPSVVGTIYQPTRRNTPEERRPQQQRTLHFRPHSTMYIYSVVMTSSWSLQHRSRWKTQHNRPNKIILHGLVTPKTVTWTKSNVKFWKFS
jgi:hypothetical protein